MWSSRQVDRSWKILERRMKLWVVPRDSVNYSSSAGRPKCSFILSEKSWDSLTAECTRDAKQPRSMVTHTPGHWQPVAVRGTPVFNPGRRLAVTKICWCRFQLCLWGWVKLLDFNMDQQTMAEGLHSRFLGCVKTVSWYRSYKCTYISIYINKVCIYIYIYKR